MLTTYGRMSAAEVLSTWSYPSESDPLHGLLGDLPENPPVLVGGDTRAVVLKARHPGGQIQKSFLMQSDVEVSATVISGLIVTGEVGSFASGSKGEMVTESRRHYVMVNMSENLSVRFGRFFPAYGIMLEDHTAATRQPLGFDEGQESYNAELAYRNELGEIMVTGVSSGRTSPFLSPTGIVTPPTSGATVRATAYLGKSSEVGLSGKFSKTVGAGSSQVIGAFAMIGFTDDLYLLSEWDVQKDVKSSPKAFSFNLLGVEVYKGLHIAATYEKMNYLDEIGERLNWFPRPHLELALAYTRSYQWPFGRSPVFQADTATMLLHYYL